jgi:hypothetical protein
MPWRFTTVAIGRGRRGKESNEYRVEEQWAAEFFSAKEILETCWSFVYSQKSSNLFKSIAH